MKPRLLIGCSGSVATVKVPELVAELADTFDILIVVTKNSCHFLDRANYYNAKAWSRFEEAGGYNMVIWDEDEWLSWDKLGDPVVHIELRKWADVLLIAPASANLIARSAIGACDNLLLSVIRAWDFSKPCVMCPAMNTVMWDHPSTAMSLDVLRTWGWQVVGPVEKLLACNERGNGAMSSVGEIKQVLTEIGSKLRPSTTGSSDLVSQILRRRKVSSEVSNSPASSSRWTEIVSILSVGIIIGVVVERMLRV